MEAAGVINIDDLVRASIPAEKNTLSLPTRLRGSAPPDIVAKVMGLIPPNTFLNKTAGQRSGSAGFFVRSADERCGFGLG